jgi:RNA-directed DNA polymerase
LGVGFEIVRRNRGAPGIDGVSIQDFEANLDEELSQWQQKLTTWTYQPSPVGWVEIPKPDGKGVRLLDIPTVRDRVVQTTLKLLLEPIFDAQFSPNSYGFRSGRSQHQAVPAQQIVNSGKPYVVDIDLSKFFDRIHHDRLIARMGQKIADKRILRLVGILLRSGVMINGVVNPSKEGAMQKGPCKRGH